MTSKPPKVDYQKLDPARLRNLRKRYQEQGHRDLADLVTLELTRRGKARGEDFSSLRWNQTSVREALDRFKKVATFHGNLRTSYTEAGGSKIGKKRDDPDWMWIDTYCGMKSQSANYVFVCYVSVQATIPSSEL